MSASALSDEDRLLLLGCRRKLTPEQRDELRRLLRLDLDWTATIVAAIRNRVVVQLEEHLQGEESVPPDVQARLFAHVGKVLQRVAVMKAEFERALPLILEETPRVIVLRAMAYYHGFLQERPTRVASDVDLLLPEPPFLSVAGRFQDHYPVPAAVRRAMPSVDIEYHHHLGTYTHWGMRTAAVPMEELWERARPLLIGGHRLAELSAEDNFLYLCHHNLTKGFTKLYRFVDLADLVARAELDWESVIGRARRWGMAPAAWLNCRVLEELHGPLLPEGLLAELRPGARRERLLLRLLRIRSILHDPHPRQRHGHQGRMANLQRILLIQAALLRPGNALKVLWGPGNAWLLSGYRRLSELPLSESLKRAWRGR